MTAIVVEDLVKRYGGFTAVQDVSFTAAAGEVTALLGPNGAGKTTTIEILEGFQAPTAGAVRVLGTDPRARGRAGRSWRARIGLVLQSTSLDAQLTVTEALTLFGGLYPGRRRVDEVLDAIDMAADARTRIGALSGGQRRRVDLGIAIIGQPEMLFLDEPTTGLDPEARRRLWSVIENLTAGGTSVLLTTHYLDEAQRLASRVVVLADGRVAADASPDKLRAMGGAPVIRYRLPARAPDLPAGLAGHVADGELTLPSADVTADLAQLTGWARDNHVDLTGLDSSLVVAREDGVLRRWRATPLPSWGYFAGRIIATVLLADAAALILVLVGVAMAGLHLTAGAIGGLLLAGSLGALALAAAGTAITPLLTSAQGANPLLTLTYLPLIIFSGGFGGLSGLPHWLNTAMSYLPAQPMIDAVTRALQHTAGQSGQAPSGRDLAVLAAWALGGLVVSVRFFRWDPTRPRHARTAGAGNPARSV